MNLKPSTPMNQTKSATGRIPVFNRGPGPVRTQRSGRGLLVLVNDGAKACGGGCGRADLGQGIRAGQKESRVALDAPLCEAVSFKGGSIVNFLLHECAQNRGCIQSVVFRNPSIGTGSRQAQSVTVKRHLHGAGHFEVPARSCYGLEGNKTPGSGFGVQDEAAFCEQCLIVRAEDDTGQVGVPAIGAGDVRVCRYRTGALTGEKTAAEDGDGDVRVRFQFPQCGSKSVAPSALGVEGIDQVVHEKFLFLVGCRWWCAVQGRGACITVPRDATHGVPGQGGACGSGFCGAWGISGGGVRGVIQLWRSRTSHRHR